MNTRTRITMIVMAGLIFGPASEARAEDDVQYWPRYSVKAIDTKYVDFTNYGELRLTEDISDLNTWFTSQKIQIDPFPHLNLGINYTYLRNKTVNSKTNVRDLMTVTGLPIWCLVPSYLFPSDLRSAEGISYP